MGKSKKKRKNLESASVAMNIVKEQEGVVKNEESTLDNVEEKNVSEKEIDEINILNASILAMHRAIDKLAIKPCFIIVDGNKFKKYQEIPHQTIVKGDSKYLSIAAASVLAKTHRDELMMKLHDEYPQYAWNKNKAYPTIKHREAIASYGVTPYHRLTYKLLKDNNL